MRRILVPLTNGLSWTGDLYSDVMVLLSHNGYTKTAEHSIAVAVQAKRLAVRFDAHPRQAQTAGWLHDVSAIIPTSQRLATARQWGLDILPAEETAPMLLHQRLSTVIAHELFGVQDESVLSAVGCHTTLKAHASLLDKVVFVADKIAWDQPGTPPYQHELTQALDHSLDRAVFCYLDHLWQQRETLAAVHPWFVDAYQELESSTSYLAYADRGRRAAHRPQR
jgi:predicted HD superfamily hydrolase involved in NAD metabolism